MKEAYYAQGDIVNTLVRLSQSCCDGLPEDYRIYAAVNRTMKHVVGAIITLPLRTDLFPVVTCSECRFRHTGRFQCEGRGPDWFCPEGQRRR